MPPIPMPPMPPAPPAPPAPPIAAPPAPALEYDSITKTSTDACKKRLLQLNFPEGKPVLAAMKEPGSSGCPTNIQSNVFGLELEKDTTIYSYSVHISFELRNGKIAIFTKKGKEDFVVRDRHSKCIDIFYTAVEKNKEFFQLSNGNNLIYDGQSLLFTTKPIINDTDKKIKLIEIDGASTKNEDLKECSCIKVEIFRSERREIELSRENLLQRTADPNLQVNDRSLTQILELVLSQRIIRETERFGYFEHGKVFVLNPMGEGYNEEDCINVGDGKQLLPGLKKSISFIEGPMKRGNNNPSLIVDAMKAAFHVEDTIANKVSSILNLREPVLIRDSQMDIATNVIKGLDCYSTYTGKKRHLVVQGLHHANSRQARFELKDGGSTTVYDYFKTKYNVPIKYPDLNLVLAKERGNTNFYPMELLIISPNQRVKISQQTSAQSQNTTRACAVLPAVRQGLIVKGMTVTGLLDNKNELLDALGIKIYRDPLMCSGRTLMENKLKYGGNNEIIAKMGKWRQGPYLAPATMPTWAVFAFISGRKNIDLRGFMDAYMNGLRNHGIRFSNPVLMEQKDPSQLEQCFVFAESQKCKFLLFITDSSIKTCHAKIKYYERKYEIVTQDLTSAVVEKCSRTSSAVTIGNIINKTNMKLGGINYAVLNKSLVGDQLIIGIGVSAPPPGSKFLLEGRGILNPSIIGYSSNAKSNDEYIGDFILSTVGSDSVIIGVEEIVKNSIERYTQSRRGIIPKRLIIYRTGAAEGSFPSILSYEIPLAKAALKERGCEETKLIYIVVSKDHSIRLFKDVIPGRGSKATEQNIPPGVVVDSEITHPSCKQFFLNSHTTLQGSAKSPLYSVIYDECNAPMDRLEDITFALCHHHQIVTLTTSLPSPLYIALEYAKRGRTLWTERETEETSHSNDSDREKLREITTELSFKTTSLADIRVNA
ncbi:unnamed protein product [Caenorhabditis bovis]|uniref:Piwi domain-containing protein n=1 Tax=Caenorhabditis bovis TaxID=2654633 RepID=A0A8S1FAQ3_9PELO|nr:unnamed protein product [Caenorhabditis bovis]